VATVSLPAVSWGLLLQPERARRSGGDAQTPGLCELDELVRDAGGRGFVFVQAAGGVLDALSRHVERRARALGRPLIKVDGMPADDPWRELCARLPVAATADPLTLAQAIGDRAGAALVLVREGASTRFGRALATELANLWGEHASAGSSPAALIIALTEAAPAASVASVARLIEVEPEIAADELRVWWEAVAHDPAHGVGEGLGRLDALESWWGAARATPLSGSAPAAALGPEARRLLARLSISQRSWLCAHVGRLGSLTAAQELVRAGALALDPHGRLVAGTALLPAIDAEPSDALAVACALDALDDPWAAARASELHALDALDQARAGGLDPKAVAAFARAEAAAVRSVSAQVDASARADFWRRWERTLAEMPEAQALPCLLRGVDLALRAGDVERALELAGSALHKRPESFATLLALGRVNVARGDLSTASCWLGKASARAEGAFAVALVEVELAEVRHLEGDMEGARRHAASVLAATSPPISGFSMGAPPPNPGFSMGAPPPNPGFSMGAPPPNPRSDRDRSDGAAATHLHARNVLGKILLAERAWHEAELHFAADACEAALEGDVTAELRARLNRSIALLSGGRLDDARAMLGAVLAEGEARGELRAVAYAVSNLAAIAILKRDYVEALRLSERAFEARRRLGDKVALALVITNIAELRLQLGMVAEAEQALAFGRQACGPGMPGGRAAHFAFTAALIHLERGRTLEAAAELETALATARGSSNGARLGECWRLSARIALEDGDVTAAARALARAAEVAESPRERAWVALLAASHARAAGEPFAAAAARALDQARSAGDLELHREAYVLLHHAALVGGDARAARAHLESAAAMRDQIADTLPEDMRRRFLARRDLRTLDALLGDDRLASARSDATADRAVTLTALADAAPVTLRGAMGDASRSLAPPPPPSASRRGEHAPGSALRRMVGRTPAMLALATAIHKVAQSDATVLVYGESGTGKELVAEAIHEASARRAGPIVKVNCAALVETLLLSELFGHEKGSFTGASSRRRGRFEVAEGGTLFLDEIGDISARTQVALLRVLQDRTFERVGGVTPLRANVRIVCATHRDLAALVARGEFREDLYYRLRGVVLEVPALRQRLADLPLVAATILERLGAERGTLPKRLSAAALDGLRHHPWPGNVRELENALRAAALFAEGDAIELEDFTSNVESLRSVASLGAPLGAALLVAMGAPLGAAQLVAMGAPLGAAQLVAMGAPLGAAPSSAPKPPLSTPRSTLGSPEPSTETAGVWMGGTDDALDDDSMSSPSKIAPLVSGEGSATDVAYAAIRAGVSLSDLKRDIERDCIARALAETGGNITRAAMLLGMKRPRLSQLVKQYGFGGGAGAACDAEMSAEDAE